jgi:hypothetical protein
LPHKHDLQAHHLRLLPIPQKRVPDAQEAALLLRMAEVTQWAQAELQGW